jgi:hypothetical protein
VTAVSAPDAVVCVTDFPSSLATHDGTTVIIAAGKKNTLPATTLPALRPLLSGNPTNIKDITAATGINTAALAEALIEQGICAELTPDLAEGYASMTTLEPCACRKAHPCRSRSMLILVYQDTLSFKSHS